MKVTDQQHKTDINSGSFIRWSVSRKVTRRPCNYMLWSR